MFHLYLSRITWRLKILILLLKLSIYLKVELHLNQRASLPINFYFNVALNLGSETDTLYSVVKIIRSQPIEGTDNYLYGVSLSVWHRFLVISLMNMRLRLKLGNNFKDLTDALAFTPSHPVTFYDDNDSSVQYVLNIQYKDGSS